MIGYRVVSFDGHTEEIGVDLIECQAVIGNYNGNRNGQGYQHGLFDCPR
jgi:hypothetical protein